MIGIALKTKIFCVDVVGERFSSSWRGVGTPSPGRTSLGKTILRRPSAGRLSPWKLSPNDRDWGDLVQEGRGNKLERNLECL